MIPTAKHLDAHEVMQALIRMSPEEFRQHYGFDQPQRADKLVVYCRSGKRSESVCMMARAFGYKYVRNYPGSWMDWTAPEE
jgi:3-mercaptopyruvate sulfurtransferase SseA